MKCMFYHNVVQQEIISPRDLPRAYRSGEPNMWDIPGIVEIGRRLAKVIDEAYPDARDSIQTKTIFKHYLKI